MLLAYWHLIEMSYAIPNENFGFILLNKIIIYFDSDSQKFS